VSERSSADLEVFLSTWDAVSASASNHAIREICSREGGDGGNK